MILILLLLCRCTCTEVLDLGGNNIGGSIPRSIGKLSELSKSLVNKEFTALAHLWLGLS